ncbi:MAG: peptide chain release factor N(5)-glutamine methyltransferase [Gammaproteobacteria bacterium]|nr:peptide chain release factor N(5)-glutamine methyltransferase [Gammaproteobacteria bacterium]
MKVKQLLQQATKQLQAHSDVAALEARLLLGFVLQRDCLALLLKDEEVITSQQRELFEQMLAKRKQGVPLAYLVGRKSFWSLELQVNTQVLIPRPETELLVEAALMLLPHDEARQVADLGTGSGAIALALARECPAWSVVAVDNAEKALEVAQTNAGLNGIKNVRFVQSDWFAALAHQRFHLILSNPPYLAEDDPHLPALSDEPRQALVSGKTGLEALTELVECAVEHLYPGGSLLLEHGFSQGAAVRDLLVLNGYREVRSVKDLAGHERITIGVF